MIRWRSLAFLAGLLLTLAARPAAAVETIFLRNGGLYAPGVVAIKGPGIKGDYYASAVKFTVNDGSTAKNPSYTVWGFCIDLYHSINVGVNAQKTLNYKYHFEELETDANGTALSSDQLALINGLAVFGFELIRTGDPQLADKLAAVQAAIWQTEYPGVAFTPKNAQVAAYMNQFLVMAPKKAGPVRVMYAHNYKTQGFITSPVPEPGVWALMIVGFGGVGLALRRRTRAAYA